MKLWNWIFTNLILSFHEISLFHCEQQCAKSELYYFFLFFLLCNPHAGAWALEEFFWKKINLFAEIHVVRKFEIWNHLCCNNNVHTQLSFQDFGIFCWSFLRRLLLVRSMKTQLFFKKRTQREWKERRKNEKQQKQK